MNKKYKLLPIFIISLFLFLPIYSTFASEVLHNTSITLSYEDRWAWSHNFNEDNSRISVEITLNGDEAIPFVLSSVDYNRLVSGYDIPEENFYLAVEIEGQTNHPVTKKYTVKLGPAGSYYLAILHTNPSTFAQLDVVVTFLGTTNIGLIIGIVLGSVAVLAGSGVGIWFYLKRKKT
ncbi:MAG: hypothetical protein ACTSVO_11020 [Candidatus Heimdallarchaeaceae archaeon]